MLRVPSTFKLKGRPVWMGQGKSLRIPWGFNWRVCALRRHYQSHPEDTSQSCPEEHILTRKSDSAGPVFNFMFPSCQTDLKGVAYTHQCHPSSGAPRRSLLFPPEWIWYTVIAFDLSLMCNYFPWSFVCSLFLVKHISWYSNDLLKNWVWKKKPKHFTTVEGRKNIMWPMSGKTILFNRELLYNYIKME